MNITLTHEIGRGANGTVYRGTDSTLNRDVAVKFFDNSFDSVRTQVLQHTDALKQIVHQNVVAIYGVAQLRRLGASVESIPETALVMEYVPGLGFTEWLGQRNKSVADLVRVGTGILDGLQAFHQKGLAHGDLHHGNVRISQGEAKLLDPMEHDPQSVRTTALNANQQERDVRAARDLLRLVVDDATVSRKCLEVLSNPKLLVRTIPELRELFENALAHADDKSSIAGDTLSALYRQYLNALESNRYVTLRELSKQATRDLPADVERWRSANPSLSSEDGARYGQIHKLLGVVGPLWVRSAVAAEYSRDDPESALTSFAELLELDWPESGNSKYVQVPQAVFHAALYFTGAAAMIASRPDSAVKIARWVYIDRRHGQAAPLWRHQFLVGWPRAIHDNASECWRFVRDAYAAQPVLRDIFATERDFHVGLAAFNLVMSCCELLAYSSDDLARVFSSGVRPGSLYIPPHWMLSDQRTLSRVWELFRRTRVIDQLAPHATLSTGEAARSWPNWVNWLAKVWSDPRRPFAYDHLPEFAIKSTPW